MSSTPHRSTGPKPKLSTPALKHANFLIDDNGSVAALNVATEKAIEVGEHALTIILTLKEAVHLYRRLGEALDVVDPPIYSGKDIAEIRASAHPMRLPIRPNNRRK